MDVFDWFEVSRALDKLTVIGKPKEKKMYKQFKDGDRVRAKRSVCSENDGEVLVMKGDMFTVRKGSGCGYLWIGKSILFGELHHCSMKIDRTQFFELVEPAKKMTVADIAKALGHSVEVVEG